MTRIVLAFLLADFTALTGWALYHHGIVGWVPALLSDPIGILVAVDLCIALGMVLTWMVGDARKNGRNPWPYVVLTLATGSVGPLLYLVLRPTPDGALVSNTASRANAADNGLAAQR